MLLLGFLFIYIFYQILLDDSDTKIANKLCFASTDPRMETFDGHYWTAQLPGEFVLYRDKERRIAVSLKRTNIVSPQLQRIKFILTNTNIWKMKHSWQHQYVFF